MLRSPSYGRLSLEDAALYTRAAKFNDGQVGQTSRPESGPSYVGLLRSCGDSRRSPLGEVLRSRYQRGV
jgi:hypothetical protein